MLESMQLSAFRLKQVVVLFSSQWFDQSVNQAKETKIRVCLNRKRIIQLIKMHNDHRSRSLARSKCNTIPRLRLGIKQIIAILFAARLLIIHFGRQGGIFCSIENHTIKVENGEAGKITQDHQFRGLGQVSNQTLVSCKQQTPDESIWIDYDAWPVQIIVHLVIMASWLFALISNLNTLVKLQGKRNKLSVVDMLIANTCVVNLIGCSATCPFLIDKVIFKQKNQVFGRTLCLLASFARSIWINVNTSTLIIVSYHRFRLVVRYDRASTWNLDDYCMIFCLIWASSALLAIPNIFNVDVVQGESTGKIYCTEVWPENLGQDLSLKYLFKSMELIFKIFIPLILAVYFHLRVYFKLISNEKRLKLDQSNSMELRVRYDAHRESMTLEDELEVGDPSREISGCRDSHNSQTLRDKQNKNLLMLSFKIILSFLICRLSTYIIWNYYELNGTRLTNVAKFIQIVYLFAGNLCLCFCPILHFWIGQV